MIGIIKKLIKGNGKYSEASSRLTMKEKKTLFTFLSIVLTPVVIATIFFLIT